LNNRYSSLAECTAHVSPDGMSLCRLQVKQWIPLPKIPGPDKLASAPPLRT
jgi:hypothetical protein